MPTKLKKIIKRKAPPKSMVAFKINILDIRGRCIDINQESYFTSIAMAAVQREFSGRNYIKGLF